jgi:predicted nucleic acid-binding protein
VIVLDASAAVDVVLERGAEGQWVAGELAGARSIHAPHLIDSEVASTLRRLVLLEEIPAASGATALGLYRQLRLTRYPAEPLLDRIWALRESVTAYDATYLALAETLDAPLVTTDVRLARASGHRATVSSFAGASE